MYTYTPPETKYRNAKYIMPYVIGFFFLICFLQIVAQFITVDQLNKVSGKLTNMQTVLRSYGRRHTPNYALVLTLDNGHEYDITDINAQEHLKQLLHVNEQVTIYYPTTLYKVLSTGFALPVSQVQVEEGVLYEFWGQKQQARLLIVMSIIIACVFWGLRYYMMKMYKP
jgi:hypothetical protein